MSLSKQILQTFDQALATSTVHYTLSSLHRVPCTTGSLDFQVRLAPSLAKKPTPQHEKQEKPANPFLPYDPALFVKEIGDHNLLLNKFSVVRGHVLLTTKDFQSQLSPLDASDFSAAWDILISSPPRYMCFFNCGQESGASQPHKHLQLIPEAEEDAGKPFPPAAGLFLVDSRSTDEQPKGFPFAHAVTPLEDGDEPLDGARLEAIYKDTLKRAFMAAGLDPAPCLATSVSSAERPQDDQALSRIDQASYNLIMTRQFLLVVPRRSEKTQQGISLNSVAFAGMILVKSNEALEEVKRVGPMKMLEDVCFPALRPEAKF
ncbi:bifunctional AP-4-A phosphorylase/ADP sulfurylase [Thoreauomyces humboldtii]|nr:bifunctional AP-4-A phosphorylase/ADP sulfurylase [Thoreauomyces humboldtii]